MNRLKSSIHASSEEVSKSVEAITEEVVNFEKDYEMGLHH